MNASCVMDPEWVESTVKSLLSNPSLNLGWTWFSVGALPCLFLSLSSIFFFLPWSWYISELRGDSGEQRSSSNQRPWLQIKRHQKARIQDDQTHEKTKPVRNENTIAAWFCATLELLNIGEQLRWDCCILDRVTDSTRMGHWQHTTVSLSATESRQKWVGGSSSVRRERASIHPPPTASLKKSNKVSRRHMKYLSILQVLVSLLERNNARYTLRSLSPSALRPRRASLFASSVHSFLWCSLSCLWCLIVISVKRGRGKKS